MFSPREFKDGWSGSWIILYSVIDEDDGRKVADLLVYR